MWLWGLTTVFIFTADLGFTQSQEFSWPSYFADDMVLQGAPSQASVWGFADPADAGSDVTVQVNGQEVTGSVGQDGIWQVTLEPVSEHGPFTVTATLGAESIQLDRVLFGDVYICSGQSNMVHIMNNLDDPQDDLDNAPSYEQLRIFRIPAQTAGTPQDDVGNIATQWSPATAANIGGFSALCWMYGVYLYDALSERGLQRPLGLVQTAVGGTRIEAWSSQDALDTCFPDGDVPPGDGNNEAMVLYNAMIHPFLRMSIFGALWYQGESNAGRPDDYTCSLPTMIDDWRHKWMMSTGGGTSHHFPFGQVQLAPNADNDIDTGFPNLRWAQTAYIGYTPNEPLHHVFTAVGMDTPDFDSPTGSVHPRYKRQLARRLLLGGLAVAYELDNVGPFQGPFPQFFERVSDDTVMVTYDRFVSFRDPADATGHELCCSATAEGSCASGSGSWTMSTFEGFGSDNGEILLNVPCSAEEFVTGIRYAWRVTPCKTLEMCEFYDEANGDLPVPPYRFYELIEA